MNLSMKLKQTQGHREETWLPGGGMDWRLGSADTNDYNRMGKQPSPTVQH